MSHLNAVKQCKVSEEPLAHFLARTKPPWIVDVKYDGHRTVIEIDGCVIDAEKIYEEGKAGSLYKVLSGKPEQIHFVAFDILSTKTAGSLSFHPLNKRREILEQIVNSSSLSGKIMLPRSTVATNVDEIKAFFIQATSENYEGVVIKPFRSVYGDMAWNKYKMTRTADVVVLGITVTDSFKRTGIPHSFLIGYWDPTISKFREYGRVGAAEGDFSWKSCGEVLLETVSKTTPEMIYTTPWLVIEVAYSQALPTTFREPRIIRWRRDKHAEDCTKTWTVGGRNNGNS